MFKAIVRNTDKSPGDVVFSDLKVELQKRGFIICKFGRLDVVLHNMRTDPIVSTYGFNSFNFNKILKLLLQFLTSNIEIVSTVIVIFTLAFYGGVSNFIFLGLILFFVMIEEQLGQSTYWKTVYMFSLLKLVLKSTLKDSYPGVVQLIFGHPGLGSDIIIMVLLNIMLYVQKKSGFNNIQQMKLESPGAAIIRIVVNKQFYDLTQRLIEKKQKILEGLSSYLQKKCKTRLKEENYRALKIECTKNIVKAYLEIESHKLNILETGQLLAQRMKEDIFKCTNKNVDNFFFRNFS